MAEDLFDWLVDFAGHRLRQLDRRSRDLAKRAFPREGEKLEADIGAETLAPRLHDDVDLLQELFDVCVGITNRTRFGDGADILEGRHLQVAHAGEGRMHNAHQVVALIRREGLDIDRQRGDADDEAAIAEAALVADQVLQLLGRRTDGVRGIEALERLGRRRRGPCREACSRQGHRPRHP